MVLKDGPGVLAIGYHSPRCRYFLILLLKGGSPLPDGLHMWMNNQVSITTDRTSIVTYDIMFVN